MVVITAAAGAYMAAPADFSPLLLIGTLVATALLASAASALNQVFESDSDARMRRTAQRPLAAGRLERRPVTSVSVAISIVAVVYLAVWVNLLTALLGALTWGAYLFVYTPMKKRSPLSTWVGAVPGALPPLMGWAAASGSLSAEAWILFGVLFLWQIPHFLAIAWMYRDDYEAAGIRVLPVVERDGVWTAALMVLFVLATLGVSLLPVRFGVGGSAYMMVAAALGVAFLVPSIGFSVERSTSSARRVLLASVLYLPAILAVMVGIRLPVA
jgi:protoheme IX farnesyltransferase